MVGVLTDDIVSKPQFFTTQTTPEAIRMLLDGQTVFHRLNDEKERGAIIKRCK